MLRSSLFSILMFSALVFSGAVMGADPFTFSPTSPEEFQKQAQDLREQMKPGGQYAHLSVADQARVGKQLDSLQKLYNGRVAGKSFKSSDEVKLVNATEQINGILSGDESKRLVCEQVRRIGSNRSEKVCTTVAERNANRDEGRRVLHDRRPAGTLGSGN
jgi:hypothetical protein